MEEAMSFLYQVLIQNSEGQFSQNYGQITNKYTTIIVFERYISDSKTIFLYAYNSYSLIIIEQQHYIIDDRKFQKDYKKIIKGFLKGIIDKTKGGCLHYINYASVKEYDISQLKKDAYKLLEKFEWLYPYTKIILMMEYQHKLDNKMYLQIQISENNCVLLKKQTKKPPEDYEEFTLKHTTKINEIHKIFMSQLEQCEIQVVKFYFLDLVKAITSKDPPDQIEYLAKFLMNLSHSTQLDSFKIITTLIIYKLNLNSQKAINLQKLKANEYLQVAKIELSLFQDKKYRHFPKKGRNSQICKVCPKNSEKVKKSSFVCEACLEYYKINITLCTIICFKKFHLNPKLYLGRKIRRRIQTKVEE